MLEGLLLWSKCSLNALLILFIVLEIRLYLLIVERTKITWTYLSASDPPFCPFSYVNIVLYLGALILGACIFIAISFWWNIFSLLKYFEWMFTFFSWRLSHLCSLVVYFRTEYHFSIPSLSCLACGWGVDRSLIVDRILWLENLNSLHVHSLLIGKELLLPIPSLFLDSFMVLLFHCSSIPDIAFDLLMLCDCMVLFLSLYSFYIC